MQFLKSKKAGIWAGLFAILSSLAVLGYVSTHRLIAFDEGFYLYAAKLVGEGYTPYADFFYPQMFLMPMSMRHGQSCSA